MTEQTETLPFVLKTHPPTPGTLFCDEPIFFRFFKHILGCRHLLSQDPVGIEIQTYMAIIACMLISLQTGRKPTLRTYEMICHYFTGLADEEELLAHIAKLQPHAA